MRAQTALTPAPLATMADDAVPVGRDILEQILSSQKKLEKGLGEQQKQLGELQKLVAARSAAGGGGSSSAGGGGDDDDMKPAALFKRLKAGTATLPSAIAMRVISFSIEEKAS